MNVNEIMRIVGLIQDAADGIACIDSDIVHRLCEDHVHVPMPQELHELAEALTEISQE
jgi:hypothetical protein